MSFFNGNQMKILRKKLQLNQEEMGEKLGIKKSYVSQLENNRKEITEEIDQILQELEQEYQDKMNSLSVKNKEYMEDFINREIVDKERRKQLIEDIRKNRKQQGFNPSILPSVDMVWLSSTMDKYLQMEFEKEFLGFGSNSKLLSDIDLQVDLVDKKYPTLQNGRYTLQFHSTDGMIYCEYMFLTKEMGNKPIPRIRVQYNPNKVKMDNPYLIRLMRYLGKNPLMRKFDICKDFVGMNTKHFIPTSRGRREIRTYTSSKGSFTIQFGDMNNGGVRVYDKKGELSEKDKKNIPYECTRYEHRVTLKKSVDLHNLVRFGDNVILTYEDGSTNFDFNYNIDFPVLSMINKEFTRETCGVDMSMVDMCCIRALMEGDGISLWSFPKRDQNRLKKLIDHLQTDSITLTNVDIKQALITFITNYRQSYSINYESGDIEIF
jgi:transcriptional regulator with XRE-family HTH domain